MANWIWKKYNVNSKKKWELVEKPYQYNTFAFLNIDKDDDSGTDGMPYERVVISDSGQISGRYRMYRSGANGRIAYYHDWEDGLWYKGKVYRDYAGTEHTRFEYYLENPVIIEAKLAGYDYSQGSYIGEVVAPESAYTNNARNSDGYWYVKDRIANTAPTIDGYSGSTSIDLGTKTSNFNIEFTIADQEGGTILVDIYQDSTKVEVDAPVQLGYKNNFTVELSKFTLGSHFIKIVAKDGDGANSERTYQFYKSNTAPIISGKDEHLGDINSAFTKTFTVTDQENDTVSAVITLNGQEIKNISNAIGQNQTVNITQKMLSGLELGQVNTIVIKADDGKTGVSYRRWTFTRVNKPPIISGNDRELGIISNVEALAGVFTATDLEKDKISAKLFLNDLEIETFEEVEDGAEISYEIPLKNYVELPKGQHYIRIEAQDDKGEVSQRIISFTKQATKMEFILRINKTDVAAKKILAILKQTIAEGDQVTIKACNNYSDENPTWEEITSQSLAKLVYNFQNAVKTGEEWELALWYTCEKNSDPSVRSIVQGISGGYE